MYKFLRFKLFKIKQELVRGFYLKPKLNSELKKYIDQLKADVLDSSSLISFESEESWKGNVQKLKKNIKEENPLYFLNWNVVKSTMFISGAHFIKSELEFLKLNKDWKERWSKAIIEDKVGYPSNYFYYLRSSENLIHHAYHIAKFEQTIGERISKLDYIVEFGGGYGSMTRLIRKLGFKGDYLIYDIPEFSSLQEFFLKAIKCFKNVFLVNETEDLKERIKSLSAGRGLFIATWSLSESPEELRKQIQTIIKEVDYIIIAYQERFSGVNNQEYFQSNFVSNNSYEWFNFEIDHLKGNFYLFGRKKRGNDRS